jgi:hypothetical protein
VGYEYDDDIYLAEVNALAVFDDGDGPALCAGGRIRAGNDPANHIAKWDGQAWSSLGNGTNWVRIRVVRRRALTVFDDGRGPGLYVGGNFSTRRSDQRGNIAAWSGHSWRPLGDGLDTTRYCLLCTTADTAAVRRSMSAAGSMKRAAYPRTTSPAGAGIPPACPGDLDGDDDTDMSDLGILLAAWELDDGGDLDGDGDTDISDLGILLADFGCGT